MIVEWLLGGDDGGIFDVDVVGVGDFEHLPFAVFGGVVGGGFDTVSGECETFNGVEV